MAKAQPPIFILCESYRRCATYLDKTKVRHRCAICSYDAMFSFSIMPDESFTFSYDEKHGMEMDFGCRK